MPAIPVTYASPGLRWGLFLEDNPGAYVEFGVETGEGLGIPPHLLKSPDELFVTATIYFPKPTGWPAPPDRPPVMGYKALASEIKGALDHPSDRYNTMCTKALGRALKRAGYPDSTVDLKALVHWRQREAEIGAITAGTSSIEIPAAQVGAAIDAAGMAELGDGGGDDGNAPDEGVVSGSTVSEAVEVATEADVQALREAISALGPRSSEVTKWCRAKGWRVSKLDTVEQITETMAFITRLLGVDPETGELNPLAEQVQELISGLSDEEKPAFVVFCKSQGIDPTVAEVDTTQLTELMLQELLGWLEVAN